MVKSFCIFCKLHTINCVTSAILYLSSFPGIVDSEIYKVRFAANFLGTLVKALKLFKLICLF